MTYQACSLCEGSGIVAVERTIPDPKAPRGERRTLDAYKCPCSAGLRVRAPLRTYKPYLHEPG